jgi:hypothetical protein
MVWFKGRVLPAILILVLTSTRDIPAQDMKEGPVAPITVEVDARSIPVGGAVTIRGHTIARDETKPVAITVGWLRSLQPGAGGPAPAATRLTAPYQSDGTYAIVHKPTREGRYRIEAVSPDGSGRNSVELDVTDPAIWLDTQVDELETGLDLASDVIGEITRIVGDQPPSPARRDALEQLPALTQALANRGAAIGQYRGAFEIYKKLVVQQPGLAVAFGPGYEQLRIWRQKTDEVTPRLKEILAESRKANVGCDNLLIVQEGFKLASLMFTVTGGFTKAVGFFSEKSPYTGPFVDLSFKAKALAFSANKFVDGLPGLAVKVSAFIADTLFDQYCEKFEGPVKGLARVEYYHDGVMWWRYTVEIEGLMTLAYKKGGDSKVAVAMKGHLVGTGTRFAVWEDALRVLKRKSVAGGIVVGRTTPPVGFPFVSQAGAMALQVAPTAFFIPVDADFDVAKGSLKLRFGPSRTDFNESYTQASGKYIVGGVLTMGVINFVHFEVGFGKARDIIDRATDASAGPIEIPVSMQKDRMIAEQSFSGVRGKVLAKGNYELKVKLCNPKCS